MSTDAEAIAKMKAVLLQAALRLDARAQRVREQNCAAEGHRCECGEIDRLRLRLAAAQGGAP